MKLFECQNCAQALYFENTRCENCGLLLGFLPQAARLSAVRPVEGNDTDWTALADGGTYRFCANAAHAACNWMVDAASDRIMCEACRHNRVIPDLTDAENYDRWRKMEQAKHYLFYSLIRLRLPAPDRIEDPAHGLAFDFLSDQVDAAGNVQKVLTGHDEGLVTINVAEADDAEREKMRTAMHEPYRTLIGHFRHEVGHYYWDVLVRDGGHLDQFREVFGDESLDYGQALQNHYQNGPPPDWQASYVSSYATCHPWEDWAETWAHYLHIIDTLETARSFGLKIRPRIRKGHELAGDVDFDPYLTKDMEEVMDSWLPLTIAVNSLNRSMGQPDLYPFVLSTRIAEKIAFIHAMVQFRA